jgi:flavin-dependent dehydrogenase
MKTDVLIVGGGPAGSVAAMFLVKAGIKPTILEQEEFPPLPYWRINDR